MKVSLAKQVNGDKPHFDGVQGLISLRLRKVVAKVLIGAMLALDMPVIPLASADTTGTWVTVPISADPMMQNLTIPADAVTKGMWSSVQSWPLNGLHAALLPDGRVLSYGTPLNGLAQDGRYIDVWDPTLGFAANSHVTTFRQSQPDSFCGASTYLNDGRLLISGGNGGTTSAIFNPSTNAVTAPAANLALNRWYSLMLTLPDGRPVMMGGMVPFSEYMQDSPDTAIAQGLPSMTPEVLENGAWRSLFGAYSREAFGPDYLRVSYPRAWVAPNGQVFGVSTDKMWFMDPNANSGQGQITYVGDFKPPYNDVSPTNTGAANTAVMYAPGKVLVIGGNGSYNGDGHIASNQVTAIDINGAIPVKTEQPVMSVARRFPNSIVLPTGKVVVTGGTKVANDNGGNNGDYDAEIWDPSTGQWSIGATAATYRTYHSTTTLMPNGTVLSVGGGTPGPVTNLSAEVYYPSYLFKNVNGVTQLASRPVVSAISGLSFANGDSVQLDMASNGSISQLVLIGVSIGTHSFNYGQRRVPLTFSQQDIRLTATIPTANTAPPGYYQVVALDANGVPSLGTIVAIGQNVAPPAVPTTPYIPPDLSGIISAPVVSSGGSVSYSISAATNTTYSWSFGDGTAATAYSANPSVVHTYSTPGVYGVILSAQDSNGIITTRSFVQAVATSHTAQTPTNSTSILNEPRASNPSRIWVVNPDNDSVGVIDSLSNSSIKEISVGKSPSSVAIAPNGNIWVTNKVDSTISVISPNTLSLVSTINLPRASKPHGLAFSPNGNAAYVVLEATGQLLKLDPVTGAQLGSTIVGNNPRHLSISADSATVLVSRFITSPLPGESTANVDTSVAGGEVLAINATSMGVIKTITLKHSDKADTAVQGAGIPNYLAAAVISPDGTTAWVPSKQDNIKRGMARSGQDINFQNTVRAISSRIDLTTLTEDYAKRIDHDNSSLGSAAVYHQSGDYLFVALETSRQVAIVDAVGGHELLKIDVGIAPQGVALSSDGNTLYVQNFMDRTVSVIDLNPLMTQGILKTNLLANVSSITTEKLPANVFLGKQLFYDAKDTRLARDSYMSCASCHSEAGHDGRVWDFTGFGEGLRNTIALKGRAGMAHGFVHWSANFDEIQDFEGQIRNFAGGTGLMSDADFNTGTRSQQLGDKKAGISVDLDNLAAYVGSLNIFAQSPNRNADGTLTTAAIAGKAVFANSCASCHSGNSFTKSKDATTLTNIGTINALSGQRLGATLSGIDVPTLRDVWATAPYLHNGSAPTIQSAIQAHNNLALNATDLANVVAYTQQIGSEEFGFGNLVTLTSPAANATYTVADTIPLAASATESNGNITKVEFYDGVSLINTTTTSPYAYSWITNGLGSHTLTAKSYSSTGSVTTSDAININVTISASPPARAVNCAGEYGTCTIPAGATATVWFGASGYWVYKAGVQNSIGCSNGTFGIDPAPGFTKSCMYLANTSTTNTPPTVSLTAPTGGASFTSGTSIAITATAADSDGTVAKVDFYDGATLLGTSTTAPYAYTWTTAAVGSHSLTAKATDNSGAVTTSAATSITVAAANVAPTVSLTAPTGGASFTSGTSIAITATAADSDGTVAKVDFYDGATLLGTSTTAPYAYTWTTAAVGSHSLTAKATDNSGAVTTSAATSITVAAANVAPTVSLTAPTGGASFTSGTSIAITATAADSDGTVAKVDFYDGATLLGTSTTAPYAYTWTTAAVGSHSLTAKATDNSGAVTTSAATSITVAAATGNVAPTVSLTSPVNVTTFTQGAAIKVAANAADSDGTVSKVDFYDGATLLGTSTTAPYAYTWTTAAVGSHSLTAKATDNSGATTTSGATTVTIQAPTANPPANSVSCASEYGTCTLPAGTLATVWYGANSSWLLKTGVSTSLGCSNGTFGSDPASGVSKSCKYLVVSTTTGNIVPTVSLTSPAANASYAQGTSMPLQATATDPDGSIAKVEFYDNGVLINTATTAPYSYSYSLVGVVVGTHIMTAKTYDNSNTSGISLPISVSVTGPLPANTVSCAAEYGTCTIPAGATATVWYGANNSWYSMSGVSGSVSCTNGTFGGDPASGATKSCMYLANTSTTNTPPTVSLTAPTGGASFTSGTSIAITATAADSDGTVAKVDFYDGATLLGTSTTAPYAYTWTTAAVGSHSLTAKATDNSGAVTTSAATSITVAAANVAPTVSLTAPTGGASFTSGTSIAITATAADSDGTVAKVDFYDGATLLGTSTTAPYAYTWTTAAVGSHSLTAKATDNSGAVTTSAATSITVAAANVAPTVSLTAPTGGASFTSGTSIAITATAADSDGTVAKVDFYDGATLLGTSTTAPYAYTWTTAAVGSHSLTAKATDNSGAVTTSAATSITVAAANVAPTVSLTAPTGGASFTSGTSIAITATAADSDGTVAKVDFYDGATLLGTSTTAPYAYTWTTAAVGSHSLTAKATDNSGAVTTSAATSITVAAANVAPTVSLTAPTGGASFTSGTSIAITATAADSDGTVAKVDFYDGATLLGTSTTAPYAYTWTTAAVGSHSLTAKATDNSGAVTTSAATSITVAAANVAPTVSLTAPTGGASFTSGTSIAITATAADSDGTVAKVDFYDGATLLGTSTTAPYAYTWTTAAVGSHSLTAKATDNSGAVTTSAATSITVAAANVAPTVSLTAPTGGASFTSGTSIAITATAADSDGTVAKVDFYDGATLLGTSTTAPYAYTWTTAAVGSHSLTAKATDNSGAVTTSAATSITVAAANVAPTVSLTAPTGGASFTSGTSIAITATAADSDGTVAKVDFYDGATLLGTSTTAPYAYTWTTAAVGSHSLTAKATDNSGAVTTSAATSITVAAANVAPTVSLTAPTGGASFTSGTSIAITATAADSDGTVAKVDFYDGATLLGTSTTAPYAYTWTTAAVGSHSLTAKATDNSGAVTTSAATSITVAAANVAPTVSLTAPTGGASFTSGTSIAITATAADSDGTVAKVDFYDGATLLGTSTTAPYAYTWTTAAVGSHSLTAKATDNSGAVTTSAATSITVAAANVAPTVSLTAPTGGASFTSGTSIAITATAADSDGTVAKVDFYDGATLLGTSTTAPYAYTWTTAAVGSHSLTAKATDNSGAVTTSAATSITVAAATGNVAPTVSLTSPVNVTTFTQGAAIKVAANAADSDGTVSKVDFYDGATLLGTSTTAPYAYTWTTAAVGSHSLTAKATDNSGATTTSGATTVTIQAPTANPPANSVSCASEYGTCTLPAGTLATVWYGANSSWLLKTGVSTSLGCSNGTFGSDPASGVSKSCKYLVVSTTTGNIVPTVSLTSPAANASYAQGTSMPLQATATDPDGSIAKVEFYDNGVLINTATTAPYSYSYSLVGVVVGTHIMTAKTYDNSNTSGISLPISVSVTGPLPANTVSCAAEYGTCTIPAGATATVWYGANNSWYSMSGVSGSVSCTNGTFGGDPASGATKACRYLAN